MVGLGEHYFSPYAVSIGATDFLIGLLGSLPLLFGSLAQLASPSLIQLFGSRRHIVRIGILLQALCFIPILWIIQGNGARTPFWFLLFVIAYWVFQLTLSTPWQSWIGDLVPKDQRGRYFSLRSRWIQLATFFSIVVGGALLSKFNFQLIFMLAMVGRFISLAFSLLQEEPTYSSPPEAQFTLTQFVKKMGFNNYGLFVIYISLFYMSCHIAAPYFVPYVFRELKFSYLQYMIVHAVFIGSKSLFLPIWGHYSDRYGSRKLLALSGFLLPIVPILWLFTRNYYGIIAIHFVTGFGWAGFELCSFNFILDCTTPEKRARCSSYYQLFNGVGTVVGAVLGGLLLKYNLFFSIPYYFVFLVSGIGRFLFSLLFIPKLKEMRTVHPISYKSLLVRIFLFLKPGPS
ncbi:MAG: MFS transporter [Deltaproteobacteria bacterium]|nr:MFS transporter [Deltaproteobacteria bacterium]